MDCLSEDCGLRTPLLTLCAAASAGGMCRRLLQGEISQHRSKEVHTDIGLIKGEAGTPTQSWNKELRQLESLTHEPWSVGAAIDLVALNRNVFLPVREDGVQDRGVGR